MLLLAYATWQMSIHWSRRHTFFPTSDEEKLTVRENPHEKIDGLSEI